MNDKNFDKRQALIEAALRLFTEKGFHGTTTAEIARNAGVATGTLFNYFQNKERLINTLYLEVKEELVRELKADLKAELFLKETVRRIWYNSINWSLTHPEQYYFFQLFHSSPYISQFTRDEVYRHLEFMADILLEGQKQGCLKEMPPELMLDLCTGMFNGVSNYFLENTDRASDANTWELSFTIFWDAISRSGGTTCLPD